MRHMDVSEAARSARRLADAVTVAAPRCGSVRLVCIDGPAGSGKTTVAESLSVELLDRGAGCAVVHMDDLYEGWAQPLGAPLSARIEAWLLVPWRDGLPGRHPRYDWALHRYAEWIQVPAASVVILEGCGSAARAIRSVASLVVWVEAEPEVRLGRGLQRDGDALRDDWVRWQQSEQRHFDQDGTRAAADVLLST